MMKRMILCFGLFCGLAAVAAPQEWSDAIRGPFPILSVPYEESGVVDFDVLVKEARFVADAGVNGFIWAQSNDAIDLLTVEEREASFARLAESFAGSKTIVVLGCQGRTTADMEELARHVERLATQHPSARLAIACRPPHDARTQEDLERYYRTLAGIARRPVIIQTYCSDKVPIPSSDLLLRLAREYPDIYGWIKEETGGDDAVVRMRRECAAPEVKTVFSAWGSYAWPYQHRHFGTRGVISERAAYADFFVRMWKTLEKGDVAAADEMWSKYLLLMNLRETVPGGHLRGFNLYVLKKRGIFRNFLSREPIAKDDISGKWKLVNREFTDEEVAEIEGRLLLLEPYFRSASRPEHAPLKTGWRFRRDDPPAVEALSLRRMSEILDHADRGAEISGVPDYPFARKSFDDATWKEVRVPHDFGVETSFSTNCPYYDAYLRGVGIGWYRRHFTVDAEHAEKLSQGWKFRFESDGAMSYAMVWVNGHFVGGWPYGYTPFACDLSAHVAKGDNVIAVRVHNLPDSSRWYTGAGLYRNCRISWYPEDHVIPGSLRITTPNVSRDRAEVRIQYEMSVGGRKERTFVVENPRLWDIDDPHLYSVDIEGETHRYGIRKIEFFPDERGFQLNGRRVRLNGVCLHHDFGVLGAAYNRGAMKRRLLKLKEAGVNAIRSSHNQPDPDLLDLCDELGLLVKDEVFDQWKTPGHTGRKNDYSNLFPLWHERDLRTWVRADRNHPCVIMWSLGNEIDDGFESRGGPTSQFIETAKELDRIVKSEDATRPTTNANNNPANATNDYARTLDIYGFNYHGFMYPHFRARNPTTPFFASESQCVSTSRGEFTFPAIWGWTQSSRGNRYVSAYGTEAGDWDGNPGHGWACPADVQWHWMDGTPSCMGEFIWTGFDYLGGPYFANKVAAANPGVLGIHSCNTGFFDLAGFPKDAFYLYQSRWRPELPMVHILPHWNWPDRAGKVTPVHVFTSGDEAELFLNGRSLGRKRKSPEDWRSAYRLIWDDVVYEPGTLSAIAYRGNRPWATNQVTTTGMPSGLALEKECEEIVSDGEDLAYVNLRVLDSCGRTVPNAKVRVRFSIVGDGEIVATDNGDETDFESFHSPERLTFNGHLQAVVRAKAGTEGALRISAVSDGLGSATAEISVHKKKGKQK